MSDIVFSGKMFQIKQWEGKPGVIFEAAVRAPGVRVLAEILEDGQKKVVLTQEKRREADGYDYRLPGGKVFDSLEEFSNFNGDMRDQALKKAKEEAKEEAGISSETWKLLGTSKAGASVDWDLHYFLALNCSLGAQELEDGEKGDFGSIVRVSPSELLTFLKENKIQEGRSAAYLWKWLAENDYINLQ